MNVTSSKNSEEESDSETPLSWRMKILKEYPSIGYLLPFIVYMFFTTFLEPTVEVDPENGVKEHWQLLEYSTYPVIYSIKIAFVVASMLFVAPVYRKFPFRISILSIGVGTIGVILWIGICYFQWNSGILATEGLQNWFGPGESRSDFNPIERLKETPAWAYGFLAIRFFGLAIVVPVMEEFFLRGFIMRFVMKPDWWNINFGDMDFNAIIASVAIPALSHPAECAAAIVWFLLVTWLQSKTRNIWDCVTAHVVTNALLGVYVVVADDWNFI